MRVAVAQMASGIDPAANIAAIASHARAAADLDATLLTTPEMAVLLDRDGARADQAIHPEDGNPHIAALSAIAADAGLWLHVGSLPVALPDGRRANRTLLFAPGGALTARYDKLHMFDVNLASGERWRESARYRAGDAPVLATLEGAAGESWGVGLTICYDLRFAELYAALALAGAGLMLVPAAFTVPTGEAHWHVLLRARAIETGAYVIAAAQSGAHEDGRRTFGHSLAVDPWGNVLHDAGTAPGLFTVDLDADRVTAARVQLPALAHRRTIAPVGRA